MTDCSATRQAISSSLTRQVSLKALRVEVSQVGLMALGNKTLILDCYSYYDYYYYYYFYYYYCYYDYYCYDGCCYYYYYYYQYYYYYHYYYYYYNYY